MISLQSYASSKSTTIYYGTGTCLSTDVKPIGNVENGTTLIEMDTSKLYMYDADNS